LCSNGQKISSHSSGNIRTPKEDHKHNQPPTIPPVGRWMCVWVGGSIVGWMVVWIDGWMNGGRLDGWMVC
jgi:hypothetical protein